MNPEGNPSRQLPHSDMNSPLSETELEALRQLDGCTLANAIETFGERLRNEGYMDATIRCLFPQLPPMLGYAATLKIRGSAPPTADSLYPDRTDWWDYILSVPAPRIVVMQDVATQPGLGALVGVVHMNILRALQCAGVVTNGAVRSLPAAESAGFHYFAGSVTVSHAYVHIVEIGTPVEVGGLKLRAGELLHGDLHGVQSVPLNIAAQVVPVAERIAAWKAELIALCQSADFSLEALRDAIAKGVY
jgi:4-hydroxy-4-methyl-2-oxoglutarate aldolase